MKKFCSMGEVIEGWMFYKVAFILMCAFYLYPITMCYPLFRSHCSRTSGKFTVIPSTPQAQACTMRASVYIPQALTENPMA